MILQISLIILLVIVIANILLWVDDLSFNIIFIETVIKFMIEYLFYKSMVS